MLVSMLIYQILPEIEISHKLAQAAETSRILPQKTFVFYGQLGEWPTLVLPTATNTAHP